MTSTVPSSGRSLAEAAAVVAVVIGVRLLWMFTVPELTHLRFVTREHASAGERLVLGWSGMRGAVSLAAALAIPRGLPRTASW